MALCNIEFDDQDILRIYKYGYTALNRALQEDEAFDFDATAKKLFDAMSKKHNEATAAGYVQLLPDLINQAIAFDKNIKKHLRAKGFDLNALADMSEEFEDMQNVIDKFATSVSKKDVEASKNVTTAEIKSGKGKPANPVVRDKQEQEASEKAEKSTVAAKEIAEVDFKKTTATSTTGQESVRHWKGYWADITDPRVAHIYEFLSVFQDAMYQHGGDISSLNFGGHTGFGLSAISMSKVKDGKLNGETIIHQRDADLLEGKEKMSVEIKNKAQLKAWKEDAIKSYEDNKQMIEEGTNPLRHQYPPSLKAIDQEYTRLEKALATKGKKAFASRTISQKAGQKQYSEAIEVFITDNDGNILFFDDDFNVVEKGQGRPIYYPLGKVNAPNKEGRYTYPDVDKKRILSPEQIAKYENKDVWGTLTEEAQQAIIEEIDQRQQRELETIHKINEAIKNNPNLPINLEYTGVKDGVTGVKPFYSNTSDVNWEATGLNPKQVIHVAERTSAAIGELEGFTYLRIPGLLVSVPLERNERTQEEAERLADILLKPDLMIKEKGKKKQEISPAKRVELFNNVVYNSASGPYVQVEEVEGEQRVKIHIKKKDISEDPAIARKQLIEVLTEQDPNNPKYKTTNGKINTPKDLSKPFEVFTIEDNTVVVEKVEGVDYIIQNTKTNIKLNVENAIPKLNGYITFTVSDNVAKSIGVKQEAKADAPDETAPSTDVELENEKHNLNKEDGKSLKELEEELSDVNELIEEIETERRDKNNKTESGKETKVDIDQVIEDNITDEEVEELKKETGLKTKKGVSNRVKKEIVKQMNEKGAQVTAFPTTLQKVARRLKRLFIGMMIFLQFGIGTSFAGLSAITPATESLEGAITYEQLTVENLDDWENARVDQDAINKMDNLDIINKAHENTDETYLVVDKDSSMAHLFQGDSLITSYEVGTGKKRGDKQTTTVVKNGKVYWNQGNQQTGAGIFTISGKGKYKKSPAFNLENERGIEVPTVLHETLSSRKKLFKDNNPNNNNMSFGCVNFLAEDIQHLAAQENFGVGTKVYVLPQNPHNKFKMVDGDLQFVSNEKGVNAVTKPYESKPIVLKSDRTGLNNDERAYLNTIGNNKSDLMALYPTVSNDVFNRLAQIAYGIMGQESTFGTYGSLRGNLGFYKDVIGSEILDKNMTVGVTQMRITSVPDAVKEKFGIENTSDLYKVRNSAIATMGLLMDIYVNNIPVSRKADFETLVPLYYNNPSQAAALIKSGKQVDNKYVSNVLDHAENVTVYLGEGVVDESIPLEREGKNTGLEELSLITPLMMVRRRRENGEEITDEDLEKLKAYRDELQAKIDKIKAESPAATNPAENKPMSKEDMDNAFDALFKAKAGRFRFEKLKPGHRAKAKKAVDWYDQHPLKEYFPVEMAMHIVNSNAYASWTKHGITLWAGASYTDLYHEAFHGFSQFFLTREQKVALYDEVTGTRAGQKALKEYARANGRSVDSISNDERYWVMEELLAEDFRKYMMSGGKKVLKNRTERNNFFRRLWNALKMLFGGTKVTDATDLSTLTNVKEIYDNLRLMTEEDLYEYSPSELNIMPGWKQLNQGIRPFADNSTVKLNYADSNLLVDSIDSIMSTIVLEQVARKGPAMASALLVKPEQILPHLYRWTKERMEGRLKELTAQAETEEDLTEKKKLEVQIKILSFAVENFGSTEDIIDAIDGKTDLGVAAYHRKKSQYLQFVPKEMDREALEEAGKIEGVMETTWEKSSNEFSIQDFTSDHVKALIHSARKYDENGEFELNRLGYPKMMDFGLAFSTMVTLTKGLDDPKDMHANMVKATAIPRNGWVKDIMSLLGPVQTTEGNPFRLWTKFWQAFYKAEIPLDQVTIDIYEKSDETGEVEKTVKVKFGEAHAVYRAAEWKFSTHFKTEAHKTNPLISPNENGENALDIKALKAKWKGTIPSNNAKIYEFLHDIGIPISDNKDVLDGIRKNVTSKGLGFIYDKLVAVSEKKGYEITDVIGMLRQDIDVLEGGDVMLGENVTPKVKETLASENTNVNTILDLHARFSGEFPNVALSNPKGNSVYPDVQNSSLTRKQQAINKAQSFDELIAMDYMSHLDLTRNDFTNNAPIWLNSIFHMDQPGRPRREDAPRLEITNSSGTQTIENEAANFQFSEVSSKSDKYTRLLADIYATVLGGRPSIQTPADKGTILSTFLSEIFVEDDPNKVSKHLYVDTADFAISESGTPYTKGEHKARMLITRYIQFEIDRIKRIERGNEVNVPGFTTGENARGKQFNIFDAIFDEATKKELLNLPMSLEEFLEQDTAEADALRDKVEEAWANYVKFEVQEIRDRLGSMMNINTTLISNLVNMLKTKNYTLGHKAQLDELKAKRNKKEITHDEYTAQRKALLREQRKAHEETILKSYVANLFIHHVESSQLLLGDLAQFKDFFKRNAGINSDGYQFRDDQAARDYINATMFDRAHPHFQGTYASKYFPKILRRKYDGTLNTVIFRETVVRSVLIDEYTKAFEKHFRKVYSKTIKDEVEREAAVQDAVATAIEAYENMEEGDAQGWITFDAYKLLSELQGKWSDKQEELYRKIIAGETITLREVAEYFPVRKYQYWGTLKTDGIPVDAFHKYSLMPLIPNVVDGKNMQTLHDNLVKQGIDYAVHQSGSKVSTIVKEGETEADILWEDLENRVVAEAPVYDGKEATRFYTPNTIFVQYLKDQLDINSKLKGKVTFPTQMRKLIELGTIENGVPIDFKPELSRKKRKAEWDSIKDETKRLESSPMYARFKAYEGNIATLATRLQDELLAKAGWTREDLEKYREEGTGDVRSLVELIRDELERQDVGDHEIAFINSNADGTDLLHDLSLSPSAEKIERALTSIVNNTIIRQKFNGESLVQVANTLMETRGATPEERAQYDATGDLKSYRQEFDEEGNPLPTLAAEVKITLQGDYMNLIYLEHLDGDPVAVKDKDGNILEKETLARLNELINDEKWRAVKENMEFISLVGVRIPVQGYNSKEFFVVKEFLPSTSGNIIVPPSEIVAKSGADFDIDKLTMMMPRILMVNGKPRLMRNSTSTRTKEEIKAEIKELREKKDEIYDSYQDRFTENKEAKKAYSKEIRDEMNKRYFSQINALKRKRTEVRRDYGKVEAIVRSGVNTYTQLKKLETLEEKEHNLTRQIEELHGQLRNEKSYIGAIVKESDLYESIAADREAELAPVNEKIGELTMELHGITSKAMENEIFLNLLDFLQDPANFISLITPNTTATAEAKATQMRETLASQEGAYNPELGYQLDKNGKRKSLGKVSPTKAFSPVYNNYVHEVNSVGKAALGLGAVDNTFNAILNRIGAHLNPFHGLDKGVHPSVISARNELLKEKADLQKQLEKAKDEQESRWIREEMGKIDETLAKARRIKFFLPHNTMTYEGEEVVSLSDIYDANDEHNIADIISQLMNGWVDVAKGGWVFDVQGTKIVSPILLLMIQAGVPFETAVDFLSNPIIRDYVNEQLRIGSPFAAESGNRAESVMAIAHTAKSNILRKYGAKHLTNSKGKISTAKQKVYDLTVKLVNDKNAKELFDADNLEAVYKGENMEDAFALFLHFIELEEISKGFKSIKMTLNYDTSKSTTLFDAAQSEAKFDQLLQETVFPEHIVKKIMTETPIGAFKIQEFIMNLWGPHFKLRNHPELNRYIIEMLKDPQMPDFMKSMYKDEEAYVNAFRNNLIVYAFLKHQNSFNIDNLDEYKGLQVSYTDVAEATTDRGVMVTKDKDGQTRIHLDVDLLKKQFIYQVYTDDPQEAKSIIGRHIQENYGYRKQKLATVPTAAFYSAGGAAHFNEFVRFSIEREILRHNHKIEDVTDTPEYNKLYVELEPLVVESEFTDENGIPLSYEEESAEDAKKRSVRMAYEKWLRNKALDNTLNFWKLFKSQDTVADKLLDIKRNNPHLEVEYAAIDDLVADEGSGFKNIKLKDNRMDSNQINGYHENLLDLADPNVKKVLGEGKEAAAENKAISEFFEMLPIYSFLQSGLNATDRLSLTRIIPFEKLTSFLEVASSGLVKELGSENAEAYLNEYREIFHAHSANFKTRRRSQDLRSPDKAKIAKTDSPLTSELGNNVFTLNPTATQKPLTEIIEEHSDALFVLEKPSDNDSMLYAEGSGQVRPKENTIFLTTRSLPTDNENARFDDTEFEVNKKRLTKEMDRIEEIIAEGTKVVFLSTGYGKYMSSPKAGEKNVFKAERTYDFLSSELHKRFGFTNPESRYFNLTKEVMIEDQILSEEIDNFEKTMDQQIEDVLKQIDNCK